MKSAAAMPGRIRLSMWAGLIGGLVLFATMISLAPPAGLSAAGWTVLSLGVLMTVFWFTEAIPVTLTGLLPFIILPLLSVMSSAEVAASYFSPVLFLILGGFFLAIAMEKWGLHKRVALFALARTGSNARSILLAVMATTAVISMFVSNSAATLAMLPVALAIIAAADEAGEDASAKSEHARFGRAMILGIAYAATLGGFGTIIGSPGNAASVAIFQRVYDIEISFNLWAAFGLPIVIICIPLAALLLSRIIFPFRMADMDGEAVKAAVGDPGRWTTTDIRLLLVLVVALACWVGMQLIQRVIPTMSDAHVALIAAISLFLIPAGGAGERRHVPLLSWDDTKAAPWHLLILLGGGLALAEAINATDLSLWLQGQFAGVDQFPPLAQLAMLAVVTLFVTEFVTNTATVSAFLPATVALAGSGEIDPVTLGMVTAFAANWGFMMPAGTPSLALAYGTGRLTIPQMAWSGLWMDIGGAVLILVVVTTVSAVIL